MSMSAGRGEALLQERSVFEVLISLSVSQLRILYTLSYIHILI